MTIGEKGSLDWPVNQELHISTFFFFHHNSPVHRPHSGGGCIILPVSLTLHLSLTHEQDPAIPELLHLRQDLCTNLESARHPFPDENHCLGLEGLILIPGLYTQLQTTPVQAEDPGLMKPARQHHRWNAKMNCGSQTEPNPPPVCT